MRPAVIRNSFMTAAAVILAACCTAAAHSPESGESPVVFSEICTANVTAATDPEGRYRNYVELHNTSGEDIDLAGWHLSDSKKKPKKASLSGVTVPAGGYALIFLGEDADEEESGEAESSPGEVSFDPGPEGGDLILSDGSGKICDTVRVPYLKADTSWSRVQDGWQVTTCTPGSANGGAEVLHRIARTEPEFSRESGFYDEAFALRITAEPGEEIWYTTDGSDPVPGGDTSQKYEGTIEIRDVSSAPNHYAAIDTITVPHNYTPDEPVDKAVVIRAAAYDPSTGEVSRTVTKTYFVGCASRTDYADISVVSLVSDPVNLFDYDRGIYTTGKKLEEYAAIGGFEGMDPEEMPSHFSIDADGNVILPAKEGAESAGSEDEGEDRETQGSDSGGEEHTYWRYEFTNAQQNGRTSERPATISFFDADHTFQFTQDVGIRIAGESSRSALQKSLNVYARSAYDTQGDGSFPYAFFQEKPVSRIRLRHADTDGFSLDAFLMELAEDREVGIERSIPTAVFLDGEYWGIYYLREQYTKDYFENRYGTDPDNLWVMKNYVAAVGEDACVHDYDVMVQQMTLTDMSDPVQYGVVERNVNLDSLIDWYCLNIYADNEDTGSWHNLERWRTKEPEDSVYGDARWNFVLYDMDESVGFGQEDHSASVNTIASYRGKDERFYLPGYLCANEAFREQYCVTMMDIANTTYSYERVHAKLLEWEEKLAQQAEDTIRRFRTEEGAEEIFEEKCRVVDAFFKDRRFWIEQYLREDQGLTGKVTKVSIRADSGEEESTAPAGTVRINSSFLYARELLEGWTGEYFSDFPVTVTADPEEGHDFVRWKIRAADGTVREDTSPSVTLDLAGGDVELTAVFR